MAQDDDNEIGIVVRPARREDSAQIVAFQLAMAWETERLQLDADVVEHGVAGVFDLPARGQYWVAELQRDQSSIEPSTSIIGSMLTTIEWSDWRNGEIWWLQSVYVIPEARRRGVFRRLFEYVKQHVEEAGHRGLRLYVEKSNASARETYNSLGMRDDHYDLFEWLR